MKNQRITISRKISRRQNEEKQRKQIDKRIIENDTNDIHTQTHTEKEL